MDINKQEIIKNLQTALLHYGPRFYEETVGNRDYPFISAELEELWYSNDHISLANCYEYCLGMDEDEQIQVLAEFLFNLSRAFFWWI